MAKPDKALREKLGHINRTPNKDAQRAALLERNRQFLNELANIKESIPNFSNFRAIKLQYPNGFHSFVPKRIAQIKTNPIIRLKYSKYKTKGWISREYKIISKRFIARYYGKKRLHPLVREFDYRSSIFDLHLKEWRGFCNRWLVKDDWDGTLDSLHLNQRNPTDIYFDNRGIGSFQEKGKWTFFLRINGWTTLNDIKDNWKTIKQIQKRILGKYESRPNFGRDLCWYDLKHDYALSPKQISELWQKTNPKDIDLLAVKRIRREENSDLGMKRAIGLLADIRSDPSFSELKEEFEMERENYIGGKYPLLVDIIKKAIKRMDKLIIQIAPLEGDEEYISIRRATVQIKDGKRSLLFSRY